VENYTTNLDLSQINPIQPGEERIDWYWWSPDGTAIAGRVYDNQNCGVAYALVNNDGSGFQRFGNTRCEGSPPFWSPDSSKIYYSAEGRLTAVNRQDLQNRISCSKTGRTMPWRSVRQFSPDGSGAFAESPDDPRAGESGSGVVRERLYLGNADFSSLREIAEFSPTTPYCDAVKWSPDQQQFAFTRFYECEESCKVEDFVFRLDNGEVLTLSEQAYVCGWSPDARLVYLDNLLKMVDPSDPGSTPLELPLIDCPLLWLP
jgi:Tol biopolymer transport system component